MFHSSSTVRKLLLLLFPSMFVPFFISWMSGLSFLYALGIAVLFPGFWPVFYVHWGDSTVSPSLPLEGV